MDNKIQTDITHLPPEILEKILLYLGNNEQLSVRLVSKYWNTILVSSPNLNQTLYLLNCGIDAELVDLLLTTELHFTRIIFDNVEIATSDDLTEFWRKIGRNVREFHIQDRHTSISTFIKRGFKASRFPKLKTLKMDILPLFYYLIAENLEEWNLLMCQVRYLSVNYMQGWEKVPEVSFEMAKVRDLMIDGCRDDTTEIFLNRIAFPAVENLVILHVSYEHINLTSLFDTQFDFKQLKTFFVGQYYDWVDHNFTLIVENCTNVEILGIGVITKESHYQTEREELKHDDVAKKLFAKMKKMRELHIVTFANTEEKDFKSFERTKTGYMPSAKMYSPFAAIQSELKN